MKQERWQKIDKLVQAALELEPEQRPAFLDAACDGDAELRREIDSLLASSDEAADFLKTPVAFQAAPFLADTQLDSMPGRRLGVYQILSRLGAGGMGEVYLAEDGRLGRKVALKILPTFFTKDEQRLRRFHQEARATSALNHPNILMIFDIGQADGLHYIAAEYIDGQTLRAVLAGNRLKLTQVLDVAIQVAGALAAAHQAGIIHRDIKPENVMVRPDGIVKVLDFGLAKRTRRPAASGGTQASTMVRVETDPGTVMGTANYMSPEQAQGQEVDSRTDIFSLGAMLYELLTGRLAFEGETTSHVIVSILEKEPPPLATYAPGVPAEMQRIVMKALRKDREERYQVSKDLVNDLKDLRQELETQARAERSLSPEAEPQLKTDAPTAIDGLQTADTAGEAQKLTADVAARTTSSAEIILSEMKRHKTGVALALIAFAALVAAIVFGVYKLLEPRRPAALFEIGKITRLTTTGRNRSATISPDGKYVVYVNEDTASQMSLWVRHVATNSNVQIVPPADRTYLGTTFSPDNNYIYYTVEEQDNPRGALYQVPVLGSTSKKILTEIQVPVTFSPEGKRLAFIRDDPTTGETALIVANTDGSGEQKLAVRRGTDYFCPEETGPAWSPDGEVIICAGGSAAGGVHTTVFEVRVKDGSLRSITPQKWKDVGRICWLRDGAGLILSAQDWNSGTFYHLWQLSYPGGEARKLTNDLGGYGTFSLGLAGDSSTLVTVRQDFNLTIWTLPVGDMNRLKEATIGGARDDGRQGILWTPDGRIVYTSRASDQENIWIMDADGKNQKQLTEEGTNVAPSITADGRHLVFFSTRTGIPNIWRMDIDGSHQRQLTDQGGFTPHCSPDGKWVVYASWTAEKVTLWKVPIDGGEPVPLTDYPSNEPAISPDGKLIAIDFFDEQAKRWRVGIIPFTGGKPVKVLDILRVSLNLEWSTDGRSLLYVGDQNGVRNIWSQPLDGSPAKPLTDFKTERIYWFALSRDGKQFAVARGPSIADVILIQNANHPPGK